jgi:hypothetical protein
MAMSWPLPSYNGSVVSPLRVMLRSRPSAS